MNFKFTVNKWSNFYFFVQNLSEWHFSCRKNYNIFWQQQFGKLTTKEKKALENFNKIRLRYDQGKTCFEKSFFTKKNPWRSLSLTLTSKEYKVIYNIFSLFQNRFEKLYKEESPLLKKWKILLSKKANDQTLGKKITKILDILYGTNINKKKLVVNIYLLLSSPNAMGGGANIDKESISLEISRYLAEKSNYVLSVIWHEIIHLAFEKEYFFQILKTQFPNDRESLNLIKETTARALFPRGILAKKFLQINDDKRVLLHPKISSLHTKQIINLIESYIQKKEGFRR